MRKLLIVVFYLSIFSSLWSFSVSTPKTLHMTEEYLSGVGITSNQDGDIAVYWSNNQGKKNESFYYSVKPSHASWSIPEMLISYKKSEIWPTLFLDSYMNIHTCRHQSSEKKLYFEKISSFENKVLSSNDYSIDFYLRRPVFLDQEISLIASHSSNFSGSLIIFSNKGEQADLSLNLSSHERYDNHFLKTLQNQQNILLITSKTDWSSYRSDHKAKTCVVYSWYREGEWSSFEPFYEYIYDFNGGSVFLEHFSGSINRNNSAIFCWSLSKQIDGEYYNKIQATIFSDKNPPQTVDLSSLEEDETTPYPCIDDDENILVLMESLEEENNVTFAYKSANQEWIYLEGFEDLKNADYDSFELKSDNHGNFLLFWSGHIDKKFGIFASIFSTETKTWTSPYLISHKSVGFGIHSQPHFVITDFGRGMIIWKKECTNPEKIIFDEDPDNYCVQVAEFTYEDGR